jgi:hypothetical protein
MSFSHTELDAMRTLIRERSGLPPPPARPAPPTWPEIRVEPPSPPPADPIAEPACEAVERQAAEAGEAPPPAEPKPVESAPLQPTPAEPDDGWRPDAAIHRLVELLMEMRALSGQTAGAALPTAPAAEQAAAA